MISWSSASVGHGRFALLNRIHPTRWLLTMLFFVSASVGAQTIPYGPNTPALTGYGFALKETPEGVMRRASEALRAAGLTLHAPMPEAIGANNDHVFAIVSSVAIGDGQRFVTLSVAADNAMRNEAPRIARFLRDHMLGLPGAPTDMPIGIWRRDGDGLEIQATWDGTTLRQTIAFADPVTAAAGFKVGELVGEFRAAGPNKLAGRGKWRVGGSEEWRDLTADVQNATTMLLTGGGGAWTWRRATPAAQTELVGTWRRENDGSEVAFRPQGAGVAGLISKLAPNLEAAGFKLGEQTFTATRESAARFVGKIKARSGGAETWHDMTLVFESPDVFVGHYMGVRERWVRASGGQTTVEKAPLVGLWRRDGDGMEVRAEWSGETYVQRNAKNVGNMEAFGFTLGQVVGEFKKSAADRMTGRGLFRSAPGADLWRDGTVTIEGPDTVVIEFPGVLRSVWRRVTSSG